MSDPVFSNGLINSATNDASISISVIDDRGMIDLRGDLKDKKFAMAVEKTLGVALPSEPRQSSNKQTITALWLSPDQWLITCPRKNVEKIAARLQSALKNCHSLVVDVSDARTIIRLEGAGTKEILMKGAPVDLIAKDCGSGYVRRLRFAELAAMIHVVSNDPHIIDLYVFRSYGQYAWDWLVATSSKQSSLQIFTDQKTASV